MERLAKKLELYALEAESVNADRHANRDGTSAELHVLNQNCPFLRIKLMGCATGPAVPRKLSGKSVAGVQSKSVCKMRSAVLEFAGGV